MRDLLKSEYNNPFVWGWVSAADMLSIMRTYYSINWNNARLSTYQNKELQDGVCFTVHVDNIFDLTYSHYQFNTNYDFLTDHNTNMVFSNHIWEYVMDKYRQRTLRMITQNIPPKYIILDDFTEKGFSDRQISQIYEISRMPVLIFTNKDTYSSNHLVQIIHITADNMLPEHIIECYRDEIMHFLYLGS
jgi:hypothetical protein